MFDSLNNKEPYILTWLEIWYKDSLAPFPPTPEENWKSFSSIGKAREFYLKKKDNKSCRSFELYHIQSRKIDL